MSRPLILVTNDDGYRARGLRFLIKRAMAFGDVVVVAPDRPQSGMGHAITVHDPLRLHDVLTVEGVRSYATTGTPVDCVKLAICEILDRKPDIILSGVNHGSNASTNVLYSGTMSAAVEGALEGIPSIGFSLTSFDIKAKFDFMAPQVDRIISTVVSDGLPQGVCLNVNIPAVDQVKGIKICRQAKAFWNDEFEQRKDPLGFDYYWLKGEFKDYDGGEDTDLHALNNGYISVVPTQFDMTAHHAMAAINALEI